ncbi:MAG: EamA family transporter [Candidatus Omnitrophota bacterium]
MEAFWWALGTACIWGVVPIMEKIGLTKIEPMVALFYRSLGVLIGLVFLGTVVLKPAQIKAVDVRTVMILISAGFLASFAAQIVFYHGLKIGEVSKVVPIAGSYYLISFILSLLLLRETFTHSPRRSPVL